MFAVLLPLALFSSYYYPNFLVELYSFLSYFIKTGRFPNNYAFTTTTDTVPLTILGLPKQFLITSSVVLILSIYYLKGRSINNFFNFDLNLNFNLVELFNKLMINSKYRFNSRFGGGVGPGSGSGSSIGTGYGMNRGGRYNKSKEHKYAMLNGGVIGGISNDGNTCFMNSVIQSLASSKQFIDFIDSYLYSEVEIQSPDASAPVIVKSGTPRSELAFTTALKTLLENVNGSYGSRGKELSTKPLLAKMPNGPRQNFFSGYNQEDAQEFYQLVMNILEREYKSIADEKEKNKNKYVDVHSLGPGEFVTGCENLGQLGTVYVPATQVDPNLIDSQDRALPLELITPVDGISAERIGCLTCGEVGGIRYSVNSGLSLNLPSGTSYYTSFQLVDLLDKWIVPEIIEDVNCNRCGLNQTRTFLLDKIATLEESTPDSQLLEQFRARLQLIELELDKPHIEDEIFEKLTIKQMIKKSNKSKQIYMSRPAPLLSIHINRSVFDPRTYSIVKNPSNVSFPAELDLAPFVAEPMDINMDARRTFRKQDESQTTSTENRYEVSDSSANSTETSESTEASSVSDTSTASSPAHSAHSEEIEIESTTDKPADETSQGSTDSASRESTESASPQPPNAVGQDLPEKSSTTASSLMYNLKAVVSHYGTHNYGHYICYRKFRGSWWRISDETVHIVREQEVLDGQGTFMLFYEYNDGFKEALQDISDSEIESDSSSEEEVEEVDDRQSSSAMDVGDEDGDQVLHQRGHDSDVVEYDDESYHFGEERVHL